MLIAATLLAMVLLSACASREGNMRSDGEAAGSEITLTPESLQGVWVGSLETGNGSIRLVFRSSEDGSWVMDSPDQGATGLPAELQLKQNNTVKFDVPSVGGYFQGTFTGTRSIDGTWYQGGAQFPLVLEPQDTRPEISRPQEPEPPYPYVSRDLYFRNDSADIQLAGTLTLPRGEGPFPAVVLVSGSGPQNRDEELMGHKPFLVLADYLTRQGIAVLRYDDRGVGLSEGDFQDATSPDLASDALAAWKYLVSQNETDPLRTGIAGHSEGGLIGIYLGYRNPEIPFLVLLAPSVIQGREQLLLQSEIIMRRSGVSEEAIRRELDAAKGIFDILQQIPVKESLPPETISRLEEQYRTMGLSGSRLENALRQITSRWYRNFLTYDPSTEINELEMPALAVFGGLDTQVDARANSAPITAENIDVVTLDGLNHLFQEAESGLPAEYGSISETMNPRLLELVSSWINGR